jgi:hypothetical protein
MVSNEWYPSPPPETSPSHGLSLLLRRRLIRLSPPSPSPSVRPWSMPSPSARSAFGTCGQTDRPSTTGSAARMASAMVHPCGNGGGKNAGATSGQEDRPSQFAGNGGGGRFATAGGGASGGGRCSGGATAGGGPDRCGGGGGSGVLMRASAAVALRTAGGGCAIP